MNSETGEQPKEEKLSAETGPREGDKVTLMIQDILVPDVKVIEIDVSTNVVTIQVGEKEPTTMAGDVFDVAYNQAKQLKRDKA